MELCGPWVSTCKRLLSVLLSAEPRIRRLVADRRRALTKAIEGLGQHGLVGTSDQVGDVKRQGLRFTEHEEVKINLSRKGPHRSPQRPQV